MKYKTILFVDGDNIPLSDLITLSQKFSNFEKLFYINRPLKHSYQEHLITMGYKFMEVFHLGKESVDKAIAMDATAAVITHHAHIVLVSNDKDFGDTAAHIKNRHPQTPVSLVLDLTATTAHYVDAVSLTGVTVVSILDTAIHLPNFHNTILQIIKTLVLQNKLSLSEIGTALKNKGIKYPRRGLSSFLVREQIIPAGLSPNAQKKHLRRITSR